MPDLLQHQGANPYIWAMIKNLHTAGALVPVAGQEQVVRRRFWGKVLRTLGKIPFTEQAVASFYCATDANTPPHAKAILFAALAYFVSPIDLVPDFVAGLGFTDDATVIFAALSTLSPYLTETHFQRARAFLAKEGR